MSNEKKQKQDQPEGKKQQLNSITPKSIFLNHSRKQPCLMGLLLIFEHSQRQKYH